MKKTITLILTFSVVTLIFFITSCGSDDPTEVTPDTKALMTTGTWKSNSVKVDGVDNTQLYAGFTLSFTASGFTSTHGAPVWPANGTWTFASADQKTFTRSDGVEVSVDDVSPTALTLNLHWDKTTLGGGRVESTEGNYIFVLTK